MIFPFGSRDVVRVKICGITTEADAEMALAAGADALGFNGFPGSKRYLDLVAASPWMARLPGPASRVAVLVNPTRAEAEAIAALPGIDRLQFHGDESPAFYAPFQRPEPHSPIKAIAAKDRAALSRCRDYGSLILLDAFVPGAYGGTGQQIDLDLAAALVAENPSLCILLAGGLTPDNVAEAVAKVRPYAVDVASGVESAPGRKDPMKVRDFIAAAKGI
jgi:phosphoribosylanthranilate isomerase